MADFTRSVVWRFWTALLLLGDMLVHLVRAATIEDHSDYEACLASPSTCTQLLLKSKELTGTIPTEMGLMTSLGKLQLLNNQLTSTIPTELGQLTALTDLQLFNNQLIGSIPTELGQLIALTDLKLNEHSNNYKLTGTIPTELGEMSSLRSLELSNNQLTGAIPSEIGLLTAMTLMDVSNNQLTGTVPAEVAALTSLTLNYDGNSIGDDDDADDDTTMVYDHQVCCSDLRTSHPWFACLESLNPEVAAHVCDDSLTCVPSSPGPSEEAPTLSA